MTFSIYKKSFKTKILTLNIFNLFSKMLIKNRFCYNLILFIILQKFQDYNKSWNKITSRKIK